MALTYKIGFSVDTANIKSALSTISTDINNAFAIKNTSRMSEELQKGITAAKVLETALEKATTDKGTSFVQMNAELRKAGISAEQMVATLGGANMKASQNLFLETFANADRSVLALNDKLEEAQRVMTQAFKFTGAQTVISFLQSSLSQSVQYVRELDTGMNQIQIVTSKNAAEMDKVYSTALSAARDLRVAATDYAEASLIFYQQGLADDEVAARTEITIKAARAAGQSVSTMSEQLTAVWNTYSIGIDQLEYAADVASKLGAATAVDFAYIAEAMQTAALPAAQLGVEYEQLASIIATVGETTMQSASVIGNAYKTILARFADLNAAGAEGQVELGQIATQLSYMGVNILDASGDLRDMGDVIDQVGMSWGAYSEKQQIALAQILGGTRQYGQFLALMQNFDKYQQNLSFAENSTGELETQYLTAIETIDSAMTNATESWSQAFAQIFTSDAQISFYNMLESIGDIAGGLVSGFGGLEGILLTVGTIMSKQIVDGLFKGAAYAKDMINNMNPKGQLVSIGKDFEKINVQMTAALQKQVENNKLTATGKTLQLSKLGVAEQIAKAEVSINNALKNGNSAEKIMAQAAKDRIKFNQENYNARVDELVEANKIAGVEVRNLENLKNRNSAQEALLKVKKSILSVTEQINMQEGKQDTVAAANQLNQTVSAIKGELKTAISSGSFDSATTAEMKATLQQLKGFSDESKVSFEDLRLKAAEVADATSLLGGKLGEAGEQLRATNEVMDEASQAAENLKQDTENLEGSLGPVAMSFQQICEVTLTAVSAVGMLGSAFSTVSSAVEEGSISFSEVIGIATMAIPAVMTLGQSFLALKANIEAAAAASKAAAIASGVGIVLLAVAAAITVVNGVMNIYTATLKKTAEASKEAAALATENAQVQTDVNKEYKSNLKVLQETQAAYEQGIGTLGDYVAAREQLLESLPKSIPGYSEEQIALAMLRGEYEGLTKAMDEYEVQLLQQQQIALNNAGKDQAKVANSEFSWEKGVKMQSNADWLNNWVAPEVKLDFGDADADLVKQLTDELTSLNGFELTDDGLELRLHARAAEIEAGRVNEVQDILDSLSTMEGLSEDARLSIGRTLHLIIDEATDSVQELASNYRELDEVTATLAAKQAISLSDIVIDKEVESLKDYVEIRKDYYSQLESQAQELGDTYWDSNKEKLTEEGELWAENAEKIIATTLATNDLSSAMHAQYLSAQGLAEEIGVDNGKMLDLAEKYSMDVLAQVSWVDYEGGSSETNLQDHVEDQLARIESLGLMYELDAKIDLGNQLMEAVQDGDTTAMSEMWESLEDEFGEFSDFIALGTVEQSKLVREMLEEDQQALFANFAEAEILNNQLIESLTARYAELEAQRAEANSEEEENKILQQMVQVENELANAQRKQSDIATQTALAFSELGAEIEATIDSINSLSSADFTGNYKSQATALLSMNASIAKYNLQLRETNSAAKEIPEITEDFLLLSDSQQDVALAMLKAKMAVSDVTQALESASSPHEITLVVSRASEAALESLSLQLDTVRDSMRDLNDVSEALASAEFGKIGENVIVSAEQAAVMAQVYPDLLAQAAQYENGMLTINANLANDLIEKKQAEMMAEREAVKGKILNAIAATKLIIQELKRETTTNAEESAKRETISNLMHAALDEDVMESLKTFQEASDGETNALLEVSSVSDQVFSGVATNSEGAMARALAATESYAEGAVSYLNQVAKAAKEANDAQEGLDTSITKFARGAFSVIQGGAMAGTDVQLGIASTVDSTGGGVIRDVTYNDLAAFYGDTVEAFNNLPYDIQDSIAQAFLESNSTGATSIPITVTGGIDWEDSDFWTQHEADLWALLAEYESDIPWLTGVGTGSGSGGGSDPTGTEKAPALFTEEDEKSAQKQIEYLEDIAERYADITAAIAETSREMDRLETAEANAFGLTKIALMQQKNDAYQEMGVRLQELIAETEEYMKIDQQALTDSLVEFWTANGIEDGLTAVLDEDGFVRNKEAILRGISSVFDALDEELKAAEEKYQEDISNLLGLEKDDIINEETGEVISRGADYFAQLYLEELEAAIAVHSEKSGLHEAVLKALDQSDETAQKYQDTMKEAIENIQNWMQEKIDEVNYKIDVQLDISDRSIRILEQQLSQFGDKAFTAFMQAYSTTANQTLVDVEALMAGAERFQELMTNTDLESEHQDYFVSTFGQEAWDSFIQDGTVSDQLMQAMLDNADQLIDKLDELYATNEAVWATFSTTLQAYLKDFDIYLATFDNNQSLLNNWISIWKTSGAQYKNARYELDLLNVGIDTQKDKVLGLQQQYEFLQNATANAEAVYNAAVESQGSFSAIAENALAEWQDLKEQTASMEVEISDNIITMLEQIAEASASAAEIIRTEFSQGLEGLFADVSNAMNMYNMKSAIDNFYVDEISKNFQLGQLEDQIGDLMDGVTDEDLLADYAEWLEKLNSYKEEGKEVTQSELDILEAEFDLLKTQAEWEEAQNDAANAKTTMRLTRDASGNWNYLYADDEDDSAEEAADQLAEIERQIENIRQMWLDVAAENEAAWLQLVVDYEAYIADIDWLRYEHDDAYRAEVDQTMAWYRERMDQHASLIIIANENLDRSFEDTTLGVVIAMDDMSEANDKYKQNHQDLTDALYQNHLDYQDIVDSTLNEVGIDYQNLEKIIDQEVDEIIASNKEASLSIQTLNAEGTVALNSLTSQIISWSDQWISSMLPAIESVYNMIDALQQLAAAQSGSTIAGPTVDWSQDYQANSDAAETDAEKLAEQTQRYYKIQEAVKAVATGNSGQYSDAEWAAIMLAAQYYQDIDGLTLQEYLKKQEESGFANNGLSGYQTGGLVTGRQLAWLSEDGKSELVLNASDTVNLLKAVEIMRDQVSANLNSLSAIQSSALSGIGNTDALNLGEMKVDINAEFPNVNTQDEIKMAFSNLINEAAQYRITPRG